MKRRGFLSLMLGLGAAVAGLWSWLASREESTPHSHASEGAPAGGRGPRKNLPQRYLMTLEALCLRLVPDEPDFVGAGATKAFSYVQEELSRAEMENTRIFMLRGAVQLDRLSALRGWKTFHEASEEIQDQVIEAMLAGEGGAPRFDPPQFIRFMMGLTLEGMFGDPSYGGNVDGLGWNAIGYLMHPPRPH